MGRGCFFIGKKSFVSKSKRQNEDEKQNNKSKRRWFAKQKSSDFASLPGETPSTVPLPQPPLSPSPQPHLSLISPRRSVEDEEEQTNQAVYVATRGTTEVVPLPESVSLGNVDAKRDEEERISTARDMAEVVAVMELTPLENVKIKEDEEEVIPKAAKNVPLVEPIVAASRIQKAYRAYMGRRASRALKELWLLKPSVKGQNVERPATATLRSMQILARVQTEIRDGRTRTPDQQSQKARTPSVQQSGEDWDVSTKSKEQIEASLQQKREAAFRRERALAYASSHQQARKSCSKTPQQTETKPEDPQSGWRLVENWMAVRPWEETQNRESNTNPDEQKPVKTTAGRESTTLAAKPQKKTPKKGINSHDTDGSRSVQSERSKRRHSSVSVRSSSSVKDDESVSDKDLVKRSPGTEKPVKARSSLSTPPGHLASRKINGDVPEKKRPVGSVKKRLSFSGSRTRFNGESC